MPNKETPLWVKLLMGTVPIFLTANLAYTGYTNSNVTLVHQNVVATASELRRETSSKLDAVASTLRTFEQEMTKMRERVSSIESSRFTSADGLSVWQAMADIKEKIAKMPSESPPAWFLNRFDRLETEVGAIKQAVLRLEIP